MRRALVIVLLVLAAAANALAQNAPKVSPQAALNHLGERVTVCGRIASANFVANKALLLAFDTPYPGQSFSAVIQAIDRIKFGTPEMSLPGKRVCATSTIAITDGRAQMLLREPNQLAFQ
jgi:hypothetical protein